VLAGGLGADSMVGGRGNDLYNVDDIGDRITEAGLSTDHDTVDSAITYTLGANLEDLFLEEDSDINGTGNTLNNMLVGADGKNVLSGLAGNDSISGGLESDALLGGDGNDTLTADGEADTLVGGAGIDVFQFVTDSINSDCIAGDINILPGGDLIDMSALLTSVTAATASGFLETKISNGNTVLRIDVDGGANKFVDLATLQGVSTDLNGLIANAALLGIGTLTATPLTGANGNDTLAGGATSTLIQGLGGNDSLTGGDGFDTLDGGTGTDTLTGGAGGDTYILDSTKDVVVDTAGKDRILAETC
jgi:Ca2+-binding RTX toxin-like protein